MDQSSEVRSKLMAVSVPSMKHASTNLPPANRKGIGFSTVESNHDRSGEGAAPQPVHHRHRQDYH